MQAIRHFDDDGQPLNRSWNYQRRVDAGIDELVGLIKGIVADQEVTVREAEILSGWVSNHPEIAGDWPCNVLVCRLNRIFEDERVDDDEREELKDVLLEIVGQSESLIETPTTALPLCRPAPEVIFDQNTFVLTGRFAYGPRRVCEAEVLERGGRVSNLVTLQTSYLVIGSVGSRDWIHSSWGRKIEKAVQYRPLCPIAVISERHWASYLLPAR